MSKEWLSVMNPCLITVINKAHLCRYDISDLFFTVIGLCLAVGIGLFLGYLLGKS
jgi:hypothetical protein